MAHYTHNIFYTVIRNNKYLGSVLFGLLVTSFIQVHAADLIISPSKGARQVGDTFTVDLYVSSNRDAINAASADITFSTETLELTSVRKTGSIITMWAEEPIFSNQAGTLTFQGVVLNPGFSGVQGKVLTLSFRVKKTGTGSIHVITGQVLANDGQATNVVDKFGSASFTLGGITSSPETIEELDQPLIPVVTSTTHPDSTHWYRSRDASFAWSVPDQVSAVRTLYDSDDSSVPTKLYDPPVSNRSFTTLNDGIMYMHVQFKTALGWGEISHFKFQIDGEEPTAPQAYLQEGSVVTNPKPTVIVTATDTLSGIESIGVTIDSDREVVYPYNQFNKYIFPRKDEGDHTANVRVYDRAGNYKESKIKYTIKPIDIPVVHDYTRHVELGNQLVISGTSYPLAIIEVQLLDKNSTVYTQTTVADTGGKFSLVWQKSLDTGAYEMRARAIDSKGAVSDFSEIKVVTLDHIPLIRLGIFIMNWLSLILVIIVSATLVSATLWYSYIQFSRFKRKIRRTMHEAESTLKANVLALRRDTEEFHTLLVKAEKKRELTKEETAILKKFKKRLDVTEMEIEKKLEQIG